ncbi:MAG TPA: FecR domain-containing protein [Chitinophagaceae bacterium]|nr:FecR domain-containing protein [Chitinophagaceae bacterium]
MNDDRINGMNEASADRVAYLVAGYIRQTLTEKEHDELDEWMTASDENQRLFEELTDPVTIERGLNEMESVNVVAARERIKNKIRFTDQKTASGKKRWISFSTAASIVIAIGVIFFMVNRKTKPGKETVKTGVIKPGGNFAELILANGKVVNLYEAKNGLIDSTNGNEVLKSADGQISYENHSNTENEFHLLKTPVGGQYSVTLPDGSRVWLNSLSSLKYPVSFSGSERVVELEGEGYFEVVHQSSPGLKATPSEGGQEKTPFVVKVNGMRVEVLGTHFNINAYKDEPSVNTTLLEGRVRVGKSGSPEELVLKPGEQTRLMENGELKIENNVDINEVVAWKNGMFQFKDAPIENVMRQVARWYDVEIVYDGKPDHHFNATIYRKEPVEKLLHYLEQTNEVHFKVEGRRIVVRR